MSEGFIIGGMVALSMFIVKLFDYWLDQKRAKNANGECPLEDDLAEMKSQVKTLYDLHNKTDQDGVPVWYVRRSLEEAIRDLSTNISKQNELFTALISEIRNSNKK